MLSFTDYKNSQNCVILVFKVKCYGDLSSLCGFHVPRVPGVKGLLLSLLGAHSSPPPVDSPVIPFSSEQHLYPSLFLGYAIFSFFCGESSARLQVIFWGIYNDVDVI